MKHHKCTLFFFEHSYVYRVRLSSNIANNPSLSDVHIVLFLPVEVSSVRPPRPPHSRNSCNIFVGTYVSRLFFHQKHLVDSFTCPRWTLLQHDVHSNDPGVGGWWLPTLPPISPPPHLAKSTVIVPQYSVTVFSHLLVHKPFPSYSTPSSLRHLKFAFTPRLHLLLQDLPMVEIMRVAHLFFITVTLLNLAIERARIVTWNPSGLGSHSIWRVHTQAWPCLCLRPTWWSSVYCLKSYSGVAVVQ